MNIKKDAFQRTEPSKVYISKPGKRILGLINGIDESTFSLGLNFQNTHEINFEVHRYIDGEETSFYHFIDRLMEIYLEGFGWFKIVDYPETLYSGEDEIKTVTAESLEIELQGVDLVGFVVNYVTPQSLELLAEDNSFETKNGFTMYRDRILFYRDTTNYRKAINNTNSSCSESNLIDILVSYPEIFINSWRITIKGDIKTREQFKKGIDYYSSIGEDVSILYAYYNDKSITTKDDWNSLFKNYSFINNYPSLLKYVDLEIDYNYNNKTISPYSLLCLEYRRIKSLSLMDLVLKNSPGWTVGYIDDNIYEDYTSKLADSVGRFEVESQDIYSFITQTLSSYFNCIFTFDTYNCKVNAYRINSVGKDTNIILGYRNIENEVTVTSDQELYTKYYVYGTDYDISYVNFGSRYIEDISYFLNTKYMNQSLIDKYNKWFKYRESVRKDYIELTRSYNSTLSKCNEIKYRVPDDGLETTQWEDMSDEQIQSAITDYQAMLKGYEALYVDEDGNFDKDALKKVPTDYENYMLIKNVIIPNLNTIMKNRDLTSSEEIDTWDDTRRDYVYTISGNSTSKVNSIYSQLCNKYGIQYNHTEITSNNNVYYMDVKVGFYVVYGNLYGINEIKIQIDKFKESSKTLYKAGYGTITSSSDDYEIKQHNLYIGYKNTLKELEVILKERQSEYDELNSNLKEISNERVDLVDSVSQDNNSNEKFDSFSKDELNILNKFYRISDYTNDNIVITSLDDTVTTIDVAKELYEDAIEHLYVESHPQTKYSTKVENFLSLIDYDDFSGELELGDFIRIEVAIDNFVKLRLISINFNPLEYDENLELSFSDMIQYKFKRNDFISLLANGTSSNKNSSSIISNNSNSSNNITIDADFIKEIIDSVYFKKTVNSAVTNGIIGSGGTGGSSFNSSILADYIKTNELEAKIAKIETLEADNAFIKYLNSELISADSIYTTILNADEAYIKQLSSEIGKFIELSADQIYTIILNADEAYIKQLSTEVGKFIELSADNIYTTILNADQAYVKSLAAKISQFVSVSASQITGVDAQFAKLIAGQITVSDLKAGVITLSNGVLIQNESGDFVIDSTGLSIYGTDSENKKYCGVQLGYDSSNNPSLILRNSEGALLLSPDGITQDAIVDDLIVTRMLSDQSVTGKKIDWSSCGATTDENGNVVWSSGSITYDNESLDTVFSRIESQVSEVEKNVTWKLEILASNGFVLDRTNPSTTLYVRLYHGSDEVTSQYQNNLYWSRNSNNEKSDSIWNSNHAEPTYYIQITRADVLRSAQFTCQFILEDQVVASQTI